MLVPYTRKCPVPLAAGGLSSDSALALNAQRHGSPRSGTCVRSASTRVEATRYGRAVVEVGADVDDVGGILVRTDVVVVVVVVAASLSNKSVA